MISPPCAADKTPIPDNMLGQSLGLTSFVSPVQGHRLCFQISHVSRAVALHIWPDVSNVSGRRLSLALAALSEPDGSA